eukprot:CAMPEP_0119220428 /NCGR_PEP_ID=MMETSP1327-20130426/25838_1 /TAXON_ID=38833 /ORGANISM="Micromonas pusilla, Strain RCC2306" /LENGTH=155 /DNA_ID=CAMNT_0007218543 /DNA_START=973 /DNA_END=1436 /DNA_ORIENTATION=+
MVVTSPVAGVISNTLSAHAGMPKIVPVNVRMPRKYLYSRVPRASPCVVTSPVPGTTLTTRLLFEGTPQIDPSSATAAPSHLCSPGMHGPNSCTIVSVLALKGHGPEGLGTCVSGAAVALASRAETESGWKFLPRPIWSRLLLVLRGNTPKAEGNT